jgi:hypothetical protein
MTSFAPASHWPMRQADPTAGVAAWNLDRPRLRGRRARQTGSPKASARRHCLRPGPPSRPHPRGRHVSADDALPAMPPPRRSAVQPVRRLDLDAATPVRAVGGYHNTQGPPACCRGPAVDFGASGGDDTGNFRTDEPNYGMEQSRTRSNVGATPDWPCITGAPSTSRPWQFSPNTSNSMARKCCGSWCRKPLGGRSNDGS